MKKIAILLVLAFITGCYYIGPSPEPEPVPPEWETHIAWLWEASDTYTINDYVSRPPHDEERIYKSLKDNNVGHVPEDSPEWWIRYYN